MPQDRKRSARKTAKSPDPKGIWHGRSIRTQILVIIGLVNVLAVLIAGAIWMVNTRSATRAEIYSSLEIAQRLASATIGELAHEDRLDRLTEQLIEDLRNVRHVRVLVEEDGRVTALSPSRSNRGEDSGGAPEWFAQLVGPTLPARSVRGDAPSPVVTIVGEPADEVAEAWQAFASLALIWICLDVLTLVFLYVILGRVLDPLASLARGMQSLKGGRYTTRLQPSRVRELAIISDRFNTLADGLNAAREENKTLHRQLISQQEQVRREIANELHDEAGACLFGIAANASSVKSFSRELGDPLEDEVKQHAGEILGNVERLTTMNRSILKRLRPGPLGQVDLTQLIGELITVLRRNHPAADITADIGALAKSYGEGMDLTLYRCIQEGVTAAIREGGAERVRVEVAEQRAAARGAQKRRGAALRLAIRFDGTVLAASKPRDLSLATMAERVRVLGGTYTISSTAAKGTTVRIGIPLKRASAEPDLAPA